MPPPPRLRCRQIEEADLEAVADLLTRGFPQRPRKYWTTALARLGGRPEVCGCPRYGYLLEAEDLVVGVLLLIFTASATGDDVSIRCNVSSWYVQEPWRSHAPLLVSQALKLKHVTYVNTSAAVHTRPILEAQGYRRYTEGQFAALPLLSPATLGERIVPLAPDAFPEAAMLRAHLDAGCVGLACRTADGDEPFLFVRRRIVYAPFGVMQLAWCRNTEAFVRCAGALGRHLVARGVLCVLIDAAAPVEGLAGVFFRDKLPRYFKGPDRPRINDLSFTEMVLFGP